MPSFPGGAHLRKPLLFLAMTWYALRDKLCVAAPHFVAPGDWNF
jgi:hypothetical protein